MDADGHSTDDLLRVAVVSVRRKVVPRSKKNLVGLGVDDSSDECEDDVLGTLSVARNSLAVGKPHRAMRKPPLMFA